MLCSHWRVDPFQAIEFDAPYRRQTTVACDSTHVLQYTHGNTLLADALCRCRRLPARSRSIGLAKGEVLGSQELTRTSAHFKHVVRDALDGHAEPSDALDADNTALVRKLRHCGAGLLGSLAHRPNCTCSTQA